jgi:hypothetical protein
MQPRFLFLGVTLALWFIANTSAHAAMCSCPPSQRNQSYDEADHVVRVRVLKALPVQSGEQQYLVITIGQAFKGCDPPGTVMLVNTQASAGRCGFPLQAGKEYLLYGFNDAQTSTQKSGITKIDIQICNPNSEWSALTQTELGFLNTRTTCCSGKCRCAGAQHVKCSKDPCATGSCAVVDAKCTTNECGTCHPEWTDHTGALACTLTTPCDDPQRMFVGTSPAECATLQFSCAAGTDEFTDQCGCGCVQP